MIEASAVQRGRGLLQKLGLFFPSLASALQFTEFAAHLSSSLSSCSSFKVETTCQPQAPPHNDLAYFPTAPPHWGVGLTRSTSSTSKSHVSLLWAAHFYVQTQVGLSCFYFLVMPELDEDTWGMCACMHTYVQLHQVNNIAANHDLFKKKCWWQNPVAIWQPSYSGPW